MRAGIRKKKVAHPKKSEWVSGAVCGSHPFAFYSPLGSRRALLGFFKSAPNLISATDYFYSIAAKYIYKDREIRFGPLTYCLETLQLVYI